MGPNQAARPQVGAPGTRGVSDSRRVIRRSLRTDFNPSLRLRVIRARFRLRQAGNVPSLLRGGALSRPVFVIGAPRSGTSLLYAVLRTSSHLAHWPGEAHEVWEADYHPALRGWDSNELRASDLTPRSADRIRQSFFLTAGAKKRLIDKTPRNSLRVPFIDALFPDARFVWLKRDGRDNVNSLLNAWRTPRYRTYRLPEPNAIPGVDPMWWKFVLYPGWRADVSGPLEVVCANQWVICNDQALAAFENMHPGRWTSVRYEDLVDQPVGTIERLLSRLDLPLEPAVRARAEAIASTPINVVTPPAAGKWRRENPMEIEAVSSRLQLTMKALEYE
jgi:hypothetical protein